MPPVYFEYEVYFDRLCTLSTIFRPIVRHKTLPDSPSGSWSKLLSLGTTRVLEHCSISIYALRGIGTATTLSRFCTADIACTPSLSCFGTTGTYLPVLSGLGDTAHTLITHSIWAFSVLAIFQPPVLYYSQYSDYDLGYPEHREKHILAGYMCMHYILLSRPRSTVAQPRPHATFVYLRLRRVH